MFRTLLLLTSISSLAAFQLGMTSSVNGPQTQQTPTRRSFLNTAAVFTGSVAMIGQPQVSIADESDPYADYVTTESGLKYKIIKEGNGTIPPAGATVKTQYTGWLDSFDSIRKFDSSRDRGRTFNFRVGAGQVIRGWDETFSAMSIGERRLVIIPPRLGYGDRGAGGIIPGGATLYFDVELVGTL